MSIQLIVAYDDNGVIGMDGKIPWHISEDLQRFNQLTTGHAVIMGRKTWESLPVKPLPNRSNIVVTESPETPDIFGMPWAARNLQDALNIAKHLCYRDVFIIGGSRLYEEVLPLVDIMHITRVHRTVDTTQANEVAYFPQDKVYWRSFEMTYRSPRHTHTFYTFERNHEY